MPSVFFQCHVSISDVDLTSKRPSELEKCARLRNSTSVSLILKDFYGFFYDPVLRAVDSPWLELK